MLVGIGYKQAHKVSEQSNSKIYKYTCMQGFVCREMGVEGLRCFFLGLESIFGISRNWVMINIDKR